MKRKFSAMFTVLMMLLSLCTFTASADETAASLKLTRYDVITNNIQLEFSAEVNALTASVKAADSAAINVTTAASSDNAKIWDIKLSEKMDITKSYVLNFTAQTADGASLTAAKKILFNVIENEDFEGLGGDITKLDDKFVNIKGNEYKDIKKLSELPDEYSLLTEGDNTSLKITGANNSGLWTNKLSAAHGKKYYNFEADFTYIESTNKYLFCMYHDYFLGYAPTLYAYQGNNTVKGEGNLLMAGQEIPEAKYNYTDGGTFAFSMGQSADKTNDIYTIRYNGDMLEQIKGTMQLNFNIPSLFYIVSPRYNSTCLIDNYKLYSYEMTDYEEISFDSLSVTTKAIVASYGANISGTPDIKLYNGGMNDISGNVTVNENKIVIKPSEQLDLKKQYLLKINGVTDGVITLPEVSKLISFDVIEDEDFESFSDITDLDSRFCTVTTNNFTTGKISDASIYSLNTATDGNKSLKVSEKSGNCMGFWTNKLKHYNHGKVYYNFEADFTYDGSGDGDLYFFGMFHDYSLSDVPNLTVHYGSRLFGVQNSQSLIMKDQTFATKSFSYTDGGTVAISLGQTADAKEDVYTVCYDGALINQMQGTRNKRLGESWFYMVSPRYNSNFFMDNYKLYAPILTDADSFPEFTAEDTLITSKYIKVTFNNEIDADSLGSVSVTSLGSEVPVTKAVENEKTLVISPESGEFPFDTEITYTIDGVKNTNGAAKNYGEKSIVLQKLWYETFDNATDISDLYGDYRFIEGSDANGYPKDKEMQSYTLSEYVEANPGVFSIVDDEKGGKRLAMNKTPTGAITHYEKYPFRINWIDTITEVDFDTSDSAASNFYYNYGVVYSGAKDGIGIKWYDPNSRIQFKNFDKKSFSVMTIKNSAAQTADTYIDDVLYKSDTYKGNEGEFAFRNASDTAVLYVDNIKVYKVVDFSDKKSLWITSANANGTTASGTVYLKSYSEDTVIPKNDVIVAAYDSTEKLIGITTVSNNAVEGNGSAAVPYSFTCASSDIYRISVFAWDSLSGMTPVLNSKTTTVISKAK